MLSLPSPQEQVEGELRGLSPPTPRDSPAGNDAPSGSCGRWASCPRSPPLACCRFLASGVTQVDTGVQGRPPGEAVQHGEAGKALGSIDLLSQRRMAGAVA